MDPDQTAPFSYEASNILVDDKTYIWVNKCEFSVYTVRIFMKCTHVCAVKTTYYFFTKL